MRCITVRNVHDALPEGLRLLREIGVKRDSRNGPVVMSPVPVATVYERPGERVLFWPERDANPAFHLYEALWMLCGRNDVAPLARYAKRMLDFSDDGITQHGAYGYRWRKAFVGRDQVAEVIGRLRVNKDDRRSVIQMWDTRLDLNNHGRDVPCNTTITFQIDVLGKLQMVVFNRSNDIIWGCYGANAVHMSVLQEYVARSIGVEIGTYTQVSVNYHAYEETAKDLWGLADAASSGLAGGISLRGNPYDDGFLLPTPIPSSDAIIWGLVTAADAGKVFQSSTPSVFALSAVLHAHHLWRTLEGGDRYRAPLKLLAGLRRYDWVVAAQEWINRRYDRWKAKEKV